MKKILRIAAITMASLVFALFLLLGVVITCVFNTNVVADVVNRKADAFIDCKYSIRHIEPTFFRTFPHFSIQIEEVYLQDKLSELSKNDTLLYVGNLSATVDVKSLLKQKELLVKEVSLRDVQVNVFVDSCGMANYDIFRFESDTISEDDDSSSINIPFAMMDLEKVDFRDLTVNYLNQSSAMEASILGLDLYSELSYVDNTLKARLETFTPSLSFALNDTLLLDKQAFSLTLPLSADLRHLGLDLQQAKMSLGNITLLLNGQVGTDSHLQVFNTDLDIRLGGEKESIGNYLQLVPEAYASLLEGIAVSGQVGISAKVRGLYSESQMPLVDVALQLHQMDVLYQDLPKIEDINLDLTAHLDLSQPQASVANLHHLALNVNQTSLNVSAKVEDFLSENLKCKAQASIDAQLAAWQDFLPDSMDVKGRVKANAQVAFALKDISNDLNSLNPITLRSQISYQQLELAMGDLQARSSKGICQIDLLKKTGLPVSLKLADCQSVQCSLGDSFKADLKAFDADIRLSDILADREHIGAELSVNVENAQVSMPDIHACAQALSLMADADLSGESYSKMKVNLQLSNQSLLAQMAEHQISTKAINIGASVRQDSIQDNLLQSLNPSLNLALQSARLRTSLIPEEVQVADIQIAYSDDKLQLQESTVQLGNSDFHLDGHLSNIMAFLEEEESLLKADLNFTSDHTDVNRLMELTSGLGVDSADLQVDDVEISVKVDDTTAQKEPNPFIVPKGVDVVLHTNIKEALVGNQLARNLRGNLYVRDGVMILEEMGFVCDAAKLQLTAMYRSPRPNHLYVGLDYHMVDIQIDELLEMIPQVDSVLPMLRSFKGGAEFHIAAETYLNARYDLKKSTLRGAASIQGQDLVLLDGENFTEIAKLLRFNKKTENLIDTVNAEITVFRNEVDIYPIQLSIDKYKAIVAGRHNLDMSFNYHVSLLSPLRLGVDVSGTFDNLKIRPVACRYTDQFQPAERRIMEQQQLSLRKIIQESLIKDL